MLQVKLKMEFLDEMLRKNKGAFKVNWMSLKAWEEFFNNKKILYLDFLVFFPSKEWGKTIPANLYLGFVQFVLMICDLSLRVCLAVIGTVNRLPELSIKLLVELYVTSRIMVPFCCVTSGLPTQMPFSNFLHGFDHMWKSSKNSATFKESLFSSLEMPTSW